MPVKNVDSVIYANWVIPADQASSIHENYAVVVDDGVIIDVLPGADARQRYTGFEQHFLEVHP